MYAWSSPPMYSIKGGNMAKPYTEEEKLPLYANPDGAVPVYNIKGEARGEDQKTLSSFYTPGPGTYDQVPQQIVKPSYPEWKIGTSGRPELYGTSNRQVGPGSYDVDKKTQKKYPKKEITRPPQTHEFKGISTVGPDAYNPKKIGKAPPSYSFGYKTDGFSFIGKSDAPGPGAYEIKNQFDQADEEYAQQLNADGKPKTAFTRTAPFNQTKSKEPVFGSSDLPGPGAYYNPKVENFDYRYFKPTWSFGKSTRDDLYNGEAKNVPGPGRYDAGATINTKTGFTILGRKNPKDNSNDTPAPNNYNQDINPLKRTAPAFR